MKTSRGRAVAPGEDAKKISCGRAVEPGVDGNRDRLYMAQRVFYEHAPAKYVVFLTPVGSDSAMFVIGPSAVLTPDNTDPHELGLFAARPLQPGETLGYYGGTVVTSGHRTINAASAAVDHLDSDKLLTFKLESGEVVVIDGATAPAPYLSLINSPYRATPGMRSDRQANVANEGLRFVVLRKPARSRAIPAFELGKPLAENRKSELLWEYGESHPLQDEAKARARRARNT